MPLTPSATTQQSSGPSPKTRCVLLADKLEGDGAGIPDLVRFHVRVAQRLELDLGEPNLGVRVQTSILKPNFQLPEVGSGTLTREPRYTLAMIRNHLLRPIIFEV